MNLRKIRLIFSVIIILLGSTFPMIAQLKGLESITVEELKFHLSFLAADEFQGRNTPSNELKIASKYIALMAEKYGLKPLMPDGSYYQKIPLEVTTISEAKTCIRLKTELGEETFHFPKAFGVSGRSVFPGEVSGEAVFLGYGLQASDLNWDDYENVDLKGKIAIILDADLPADHVLSPKENRRLLRRRGSVAREKGAAAVIFVVSKEREDNFIQNGYLFDNSERGRRSEDTIEQGAPLTSSPFFQLEVRHGVAATILGIPMSDLGQMFEQIRMGQQISHKNLTGKNIEISLGVNKRKGYTYNVVAFLEGSDPQLKDEYVLFGSHHDHNGAREGKVYNGADDNGSGTVAMLELAQAMVEERPKRSVIFVWHTGEEKGLWGAHHFVAHSPVPVEKMSAELNMDMLCRNDPNSLYLIGSNKLSSELDAAIHDMNDKYIHLNLDYKYEDPTHPDRFFYRSDQYAYIRYGIPGVWFFCGTTEDYHQETDTIDRVDFEKMEKVTKLVYLTAYEIGNKDEMLKLDIHPEITTRGKHNTKINWGRPQEKK